MSVKIMKTRTQIPIAFTDMFASAIMSKLLEVSKPWSFSKHSFIQTGISSTMCPFKSPRYVYHMRDSGFMRRIAVRIDT